MAWTHQLGQVRCLTNYCTLKMIITKLQEFPLIQFIHAYVKTTFQTVVDLGSTGIQILAFHIWCILVKRFKYM